MATVFFSYSHVDEDYRDRLETSLAMLKRQGVIDTWHDRRIVAGEDLGESISEALERAEVILLLVSPHFIASDYCFNIEMTRALERHHAGEARVIPIILRTCDWKASPLGALLAVPKDGRPITKWPDVDDAFQDVVESIRMALPKPVEGTSSTVQSTSQVSPLPTVARQRSSNLRLAKRFSEADRDSFLYDAFQFIADFFEGSLTELAARHDGVQTTFRRVDANRFTAVVYLNGEAKARCKIALGSMLGNGISYASNDRAADNTMNENLSVVSDDQGLYLNSMGMAHWIEGGGRGRHLTFEGAAEYYWAMLIAPLQRS